MEKDPTVTTKDDNNLAPGDVVSGLEASELVEIKRVAPFGGKTLVEGVGLQSRRVVKRPLAAEELAALVKVRGQQHRFDGDARLFLLFNYDISWNPNRLGQRMDRIHRYGQRKDCVIFNFVATKAVEERMLKRVFEKLKEVRDVRDDDAVFNVVAALASRDSRTRRRRAAPRSFGLDQPDVRKCKGMQRTICRSRR